MPAEEIRPANTQVRPYVDLSRPGPSPLGRLSDALGALTKAGTRLTHDLQDAELKKTAEKLQNATPEEAEEIAESAFFPLARMAAENEQGMALARQSDFDVLEAMGNTTDPIAARDLLAQHQADLEAQVTTNGAKAGIREHLASKADKFYAASSIARKERQKFEASVVRSDVQAAAINDDPETFHETVATQLDLTLISGQSVDELNDTTLATLEVHAGAADDNDSKSTVRQDAIVAAEGILTLPLSSGQKKKHTDFISRQRSILEANLVVHGTAAASNQNFKRLQEKILNYQDEGQPVPTELADEFMEAAMATSDRTATKDAHDLLTKVGEHSILASPIVVRAARQNTALLKNSDSWLTLLDANGIDGETNVSPTIHADIISAWKQAVTMLPDSVIADPVQFDSVVNDLFSETVSQKLKGAKVKSERHSDLLGLAEGYKSMEEAARKTPAAGTPVNVRLIETLKKKARKATYDALRLQRHEEALELLRAANIDPSMTTLDLRTRP